ncbi:hypothetical protein V866_004501 [Kwoniella sp. B9012]
MPSSSSNTKWKKTKFSSRPRYQITPQSFQILHPVHYQILDILKEDIPVILLQTCRYMYDKLIPKIYKRIEIDEDSYDRITKGVNIEIDTESEQDDNDKEERSNDGPAACKAPTDGTALPIPALKNEALSHASFISFNDIRGALGFVRDSERRSDWSCCLCSNNYTLIGQLFPNAAHLHFGGRLVGVLAAIQFADDLPIGGCEDPRRIEEFLNFIPFHMTPTIVCLKWPEDWESKKWLWYYPDDEWQEDEDWAIKQGMNELLLNISRTFASLKRMALHINIEQFHLVTYNMEEFSIASSKKFTFYISKEPMTTSVKVVQTLWSHFKSLDKCQLTFEYSVPYSKRYKKALGDLSKAIKSEDLERFNAFKERLEMEGEEYFSRDSIFQVSSSLQQNDYAKGSRSAQVFVK